MASNRLIRHFGPDFRQQVLDVTQAKAETDSVLDHGRWEVMADIRNLRHPTHLPQPHPDGQPVPVTMSSGQFYRILNTSVFPELRLGSGIALDQ